MENVKLAESGVLCKMDGGTFHSFTKNMRISNSGAMCHITNNDTGLYEITKINESVKGCAGKMSTTTKSKLCMKICQADGTEWVHIMCPMKYCDKASGNL